MAADQDSVKAQGRETARRKAASKPAILLSRRCRTVVIYPEIPTPVPEQLHEDTLC